MANLDPASIPPADVAHLRTAARLAWRGHGRAEPNPLVGCVVTDAEGRRVGWGFHARCGGPHAEVNALVRAGNAARGGTAYVTLEPCAHTGRTPPCVDALLRAGIRRVVIGRADPHPRGGGGAEKLRAAGVEIAWATPDSLVLAPAAAFVHRLRTGRPFVTAKWAQTIDGRIATAAGVSNWISSERSRRLVHRARGRVDAILTGIGTVLTDDPQLTARGVRVRRVARRVVIDPQFRTPMDAQLVVTATQTPTTIIGWAGDGGGRGERRVALAAAGVDVIPLGEPGADVPLDTALRLLVERHDVTNVLVEGGAGLVGRLFDADLVNAAWVFVAPRLFADDDAVPCARGRRVVKLAEGIPLRLNGHHVRGGDVLLRYSVASAAAGPS